MSLPDLSLVGVLIAALGTLVLMHMNLRARHRRCKAALSRVRKEREDLRNMVWELTYEKA